MCVYALVGFFPIVLGILNLLLYFRGKNTNGTELILFSAPIFSIDFMKYLFYIKE